MVFYRICAKKKSKRDSFNNPGRLKQEGIGVTKGEKSINRAAEGKVEEQKRGKQMKNSPEKITRSFISRPGKAVEVAVRVFNRKRNNGQVMNRMATGKQGINCAKEAFAKSAGFGTIIAGEDAGRHGI